VTKYTSSPTIIPVNLEKRKARFMRYSLFWGVRCVDCVINVYRSHH